MAEPVRWQDAWWYQQADGSWVRFNDATQEWEPVAAQAQAGDAQPAYAPSGGMSTGAKWAIGVGVGFVALLVLAILAAIAIPVFLSQREKAWVDQVEAGLQSAATAQESFCTMNEARCYTTSLDDLYEEGLIPPPDVELQVVRADRLSYCIEGRQRELPNDIWSFDSMVGLPREGPCM